MILYDALSQVEREYKSARKLYPAFSSAHEGLGVLWEEFEEVKKEVFKCPAKRDYNKMRKEAIQLAAMAVHFAMVVAPKPNSIETSTTKESKSDISA